MKLTVDGAGLVLDSPLDDLDQIRARVLDALRAGTVAWHHVVEGYPHHPRRVRTLVNWRAVAVASVEPLPAR
nr:hypothetical protein [Micromonospora sp. DSM 115978]